ncbi:DUF625-domain-containing protein [Polychaeton citri CBS 116435]|uniref:DUF625-domain-containing protein n=1 Tax=Polychaeton citri CBS 116435 TaxID=1314669 RepID=A0A9P4UMV1_9PEZI|nr:DUF625-domain-containing protein [Polychaeton citri CBS 116435]
MMAVATNGAANERKRVKVYELRNNDWYDRGTGFCSGAVHSPANAPPENLDARIIVISEEDAVKSLLETRITKDDGYQKQQDTLIVWTEQNGVDMALSFQESEGCANIWEFVSDIQGRLSALAPGDDLDDDLLDPIHPITLPDPELGKLDEIEGAMRAASTSGPGREGLQKFLTSPEQPYVLKLIPLVERAEQQQSLPDLHRLCNIMKSLILLNDSAIIETIVSDNAIMGVVGALEYDPDFPTHKANHRRFLAKASRFKEVIRIEDDDIRRKIQYTYRLLYLKDVVLARILDDPTFSVLNSLIFFHQVDIINFIQQNVAFLQELFGLFSDEDPDPSRRKEAVLFIANTGAVAKTIQAQSRNQLYQTYIRHGLFDVIAYALRNHDVAVRVAATEILTSLMDHDAQVLRQHNFTALKEKNAPLLDTLVDLLLVEVDLGVKSHMADAIKLLVDPQNANISLEMMNRNVSADFMAKQRGLVNQNAISKEMDDFIQYFYDACAPRLFKPLRDLEDRSTMGDLSVQQLSLFVHLLDMLSFFVRQHAYKSKLFILSENIHSRVGQLLQCPQGFIRLCALKCIRTCIALKDEFHNRQLESHGIMGRVLNLVFETMPRDNLINSVCIDIFEHIKRENIRQLIYHLVQNYRERLMSITYVNTFQTIVLRYDQMQAGYVPPNGNEESFTTQEGTPQRLGNGGRFDGLRDQDAEEEAYFNGEDDIDVDDEDVGLPTQASAGLTNGAAPVRPLVNYPADEDEDEEDSMDMLASSPDPLQKSGSIHSDNIANAASAEAEAASSESTVNGDEEPRRGRDRTPVAKDGSPGMRDPSTPDSVLSKRRREEDDEDELSKVMGGAGAKRRNSSVSSSVAIHSANDQPLPQQQELVDEPAEAGGGGGGGSPHTPNGQSQQQQLPHGQSLRRKGSLKTRNDGNSATKFNIKPIPVTAVKASGDENEENRGDGGGGENG